MMKEFTLTEDDVDEFLSKRNGRTHSIRLLALDNTCNMCNVTTKFLFSVFAITVTCVSL